MKGAKRKKLGEVLSERGKISPEDLNSVIADQHGKWVYLGEILLERGTWPRLPEAPVHDGSSNWERLAADLALEVALHRELNMEIAEWDGVEPKVADRLREFAAEEDNNIDALRDLTLRCDPQALD